MRIEVKGRNLPVSDELREQIERRFARVANQVSALSLLEVELSEQKTPGSAASQCAEATLYLKGVTLRCKDASRDMSHAIHLISDDMARQVKRHRDKRRNRREGRTPLPAEIVAPPEGPGEGVSAI